ncbi:MAG TPA: M20/M25/M40 family metallo-hydrolase [Xanthomonadaceae bacterium]|nr:M20/M25/M40 family metallo-hydrolase [Xanthomonadaceae bacterium]
MRLSRRYAALAATSVACTLLLATGCHRAPEPDPAVALARVDPIAAVRIEADVRHLADDAMEGRETGTRGYRRASAYVAERFRQAGLQPGGDDGGWFQRVPLLRATRDAEGARLAIVRDGEATELAFGTQFLPALQFDAPSHHLEAPAVFVGQAVHAPALDHDDFEGVDLAGKIAVVFQGAPASFDNDRRAFHSSRREKLRTLAEQGAIGVLWVNSAADEVRAPWARGAANWDKPGLRLRDSDGSPIGSLPQLQAVASVSAAAADAVFAGTGKTAAQLHADVVAGEARAFALPGTIVMAGRTRIEPLDSRNVVARMPAATGTDPQRASEHIVYTAHLDHVGIGAPVDGDAIYNGALDNALGVAIMLEAARALVAADDPPRRPLLFVALTAEEQGLLGAEWFAAHPPLPAGGSLVANINMDMPILLAPSRDAVPIGIEHSTLQATVEQAADELGLALSPDPFPEEVVFVRSDQYAFIRAGVPAVYLDGGVLAAPSSAGKVADATTAPHLAARDFLRTCYHQPCDDVDQSIQYGDAAKLARLNARIGQLVGAAEARPQWNPGDFFGDRFATPDAARN